MKKIIITIMASLLAGGAIAQVIQSGAGTSFGNLIASSLGLGNGLVTAPSLTFSSDPTTGWYRNSGGQWTWATGGTNEWNITATSIRGASNGIFCLSSSDAVSGCDTGITRHATAGIFDFGNGTAQSTVGGIQTGNATLTSLTTGTNADFLCLNAGGGILIQTTACTISSLRFKPDWQLYHDDAIAKVKAFDVGTFHLQTGPNADPNSQSLQAGLSAENVASVAPECAIYENDMKTPKSYRQECVIALLVKAIQQLNKSK